ncbi:hypothetical protein GOP47_0021532, partial [Adiantum capillus-veneris]
MLSTAAKEESSSAVPSPTTPSPPPPPPTASVAATSTSVAVDDKVTAPGKKVTRQWEAWTHEEEENFFVALRHVGKNFDKITSKVQSKNKDQVRHYYYRVIRRINKLLGPGFSLDAKNTKDANSAMLRWWSLLEKQSCASSKLHLKPRRFKTFVTALEHQLLKDRVKADKQKRPSRAVSVVVTPVAKKSTTSAQEAAKAFVTDDSGNSKLITGKNRNYKRQEPSQASKRRKKGSDSCVSAAAIKRWEKAASAGVSLVAEAAEQVEREAFQQLGQVEANVKESKLSSQQVSRESVSLVSAQVDAMEGRLEDGKLRLQLYPVDETTRKFMEQDGLNPFLQLTLKPRKPISSVVRHLIQKWGRSSAAMGEFYLFPFNAQSENISSCKSWSLHDANVSAGDVFSCLGNPSVFRLRYGWFSSCILQSPLEDCLRAEGGLQTSATTNGPIRPSSYALPCLPCCENSGILRGSDIHSQANEAVHNEQPFPEPLESRDKQLSSLSTVAVAHLHQAVSVSPEKSISCVNRVDALVPMDVRTNINAFGQGSVDCSVNGGKAIADAGVHKVQESGDNLGSCSWLYEGSNDSFIQRIWAVQDSPGAVPLLPSDIDWADTLTNISVGEFLNEVSQAGHLTSGLASLQALQPIQSLDSFDAAVAAQGADISGTESKLMQNPETPAWDGEETCDAFAFQRLVSQRRTVHPVLHSIEPPSSIQTLRDPDGIGASLVDCGSLEAWKQSFNHAEPSFPEELKYNSNSRFSSQQLEHMVNGNSSQDFTWAHIQAISSSKDDLFLAKTKGTDATLEAN